MSARPSRRGVLAGGGLVVAFAWGGARAQPAAPAPDRGSMRATPMLDAWIRVAPDGKVSVFTGKAELGQGIATALLSVAAEELALGADQIALITADTARTPDEGLTAGSNSMHDSGAAILAAAANVRVLLTEEAARRWAVAPARLKVDKGAVVAPDGRRLGYGELAAGVSLKTSARDDVTPRIPSPGRPSPMRFDIPGKLSGAQAYVQDLRFPGMLHARVVRAPANGQRIEIDPAAAPAGVELVRKGRFCAVAAASEWQAILAMRQLQRGKASQVTPLPPADGAHAALLASPSSVEIVLDRKGPDPAGKVVKARYSRPYLMHGSIGPSCAVAWFRDGEMTVWTHSQGVFILRQALAELLHLPPDKVHCVHVAGSGCYGHNGADDVAADAAMTAQALPGRPIRLQWMREQEHGWEPLGSPQVTEQTAVIGADGRIAGWTYEVWSHPHNVRPQSAGRLLAGQEVEPAFPFPPPVPIPMPQGDGHRNSVPIYAVPTAKVLFHFAPASPLRTSALRSLGAHHNVFSIESFMDELALAAGQDPVAFRLKHLDDPRARDVVQTAADRFGWPARDRRAANAGRGFAFARYKNLAAYCAVALEVEVEPRTGAVRIGRVVAAVDSGRAASADGIRNQIEGAIVQSLSWTGKEESRFTPAGRTSLNWGAYPILRFQDLPASVEVHVIDRPAEPFLGTGEAGQGPTAAALANAIADATGKRLRDMPFTPAKVLAARS